MTGSDNINARIVEALYTEALVLADATRSRFDELREAAVETAKWARATGPDAGFGRADDVEVTCEALRTTTRVLHCLAWLLNHRAWFAGDISAAQLRRHGQLVTYFPASDPAIVERLPGDLADLIHHSERLYERIQRLDGAWRSARPAAVGAIERLRDRLALATLRKA